MNLLRPLILWHRWLGVAVCVLMAAWFASGITIYFSKAMPGLTQQERISGSAAVSLKEIQLTPAQAVGASARTGPGEAAGRPEAGLRKISIRAVQRRPVYFIEFSQGMKLVFADSGEVLSKIDAQGAERIARDFYQGYVPAEVFRTAEEQSWKSIKQESLGDANPKRVTLVEMDQWTMSGSLKQYRPLWKVEMGDRRGTELYVSSKTGEVVCDTGANERLVSFTTGIPHYIYLYVIARFREAWRWLVIGLSGVGVALVAAGLVVGVLRYKRSPKHGASGIPYKGLMRLHYWGGAIFGVLALTWVFSGMMSLDPFRLRRSTDLTPAEQIGFNGGLLDADRFSTLPATSGEAGANVFKIGLFIFNGKPYYDFYHRTGQHRIEEATAATTHQAVGFSEAQLGERIAKLGDGAPLLRVEKQADYDSYYYPSKWSEDAPRPLPVLLAKFADRNRTWFYIDGERAQVVQIITAGGRFSRWAYQGLHFFDFRVMRDHPLLRGLFVLSFCLGGLGLSLTGVILGVKRVRMKTKSLAAGLHARQTDGGK